MERKRIVLVTGMGGAGKTSAMGILEDMGYHCIDQYPVQLLKELSSLIESSNDPRFQYVALATTALDFSSFIQAFNSDGFDTRTLFLQASDEELLLRYKQTRRTHPLLLSNKSNTLEDAIHLERDMFIAVQEVAFLSVDTTFLKSSELKKMLDKYFALISKPVFSISFISFGYKKGVPMDADLMFDVRFLPNPFWVEELKEKTGLESEVYEYVMGHKQTQKCLKKMTEFLNYAFKEYVKEGKNHFTVAIGCTGGKHRSVSVVRYLYNYYSKQYNCFINHRDVENSL